MNFDIDLVVAEVDGLIGAVQAEIQAGIGIDSSLVDDSRLDRIAGFAKKRFEPIG